VRSTPAGLQAQTRPGFQKPQDTTGSRFQPRPAFHPGFKNRSEPSLVQDVSRKEIKLLKSPMSVETQQRLEEVKPRAQLRPEWTAGLEFKPKIKSDLVKDVSRKEIKLLQSPMIVDTQQRLEELKPGSQMKPKPGTQLRPEWTAGLEFKPMIKSDLALGFDNRSFQVDSSNESMQSHQESSPGQASLSPGHVSSKDEITSPPEDGYQLRSYWRGLGSGLGVDKKPYQVQTVNEDGKGFQYRLDQGAGTRPFQAQTRDDLLNPELESISNFQEIKKLHTGAESQCKSEIRKGLGLLDKKPIQFQPRDEHYMPMRPDQDAERRTGFSDIAFQIQTKDERMSKTAANFQPRQYQDAGFITGSSDRALQIQPRYEIRIGTGVKLQSRPYQDAGLKTGFSDRAFQIQTKDERMSQRAANLQPRQYQDAGFITGSSDRALQIQPRDEIRIGTGVKLQSRPYQDTGLITGAVSQIQTRDENMMQTGTGPGAREESRINLKLDRSRSHQVQQLSQAAGFDTEGQSGENSLEKKDQFRQQLEAKLSLIFAQRNFPKKVEEEDSIDVPEGGWGGLKIKLEAVTEEETEV
jgi:hypothetical protein